MMYSASLKHLLLNLTQAVEAERDCTVALDLESTNTKALYRRGLARKVSLSEGRDK